MFVRPGEGFLENAKGDQPLAAWHTEAERSAFTKAYAKTGFRGELSRYRNLDRNWDLSSPWQGARIHQPSLFIAGSKDAVNTGLIGARAVDELERVLPNLKGKLIIEGSGHWV